MKVKKLHKDAIVPKYATSGSAGFDLHARLDGSIFINPGQCIKVGTGLAFAVPHGHMMLAVPRSGLGSNSGIVLGNLSGIIDSDYRGEVMLTLWNRNHDGQAFEIKPGDRCIQAIIVPVVQESMDVVEELDETERGSGGFGSTGSK